MIAKGKVTSTLEGPHGASPKASKVIKSTSRQTGLDDLINTNTYPYAAVLKDGTLSLEKTPEHLVEIVKRNATSSRLLRLPAELRLKIWEYALIAPHIRVHTEWIGGVANTRCAGSIPVRIAFRLPRVCRQIYSETATLTYSLNTFHLCNDAAEVFQEDFPAFRRTMRSIVVSVLFLHRHSSTTLLKLYPGLERLHVYDFWYSHQRKWIEDMIKNLQDEAGDRFVISS